MCVSMKGANKAHMIILLCSIPEWTFVECGLETTADVVPEGQIFATDLEHLVDNSQWVFRTRVRHVSVYIQVKNAS